MEKPLAAYKGDGPYVFVSYSHADEDVVFAEIRWLQEQGINVWYDTTGIGPGGEWNDEIARAIQNATRFIYFITPQSVTSEHCRRELNFSQAEGLSVIAVQLEPTDVPPGLRLSLDNRQSIFRHRLEDDEYRSALIGSLTSGRPKTPFVAPGPKPQRSRASRAVLVALAVVLAAPLAWYGGRSVTSSNEGASESALTPTTVLTAEDAEGALVPRRNPGSGGTDNPQAYAHFVVGRELQNVDPERALNALQKAVEIDPEFALAWTSMSFAYGSLARDPAQTATALANMSTAAARAVSTSPNRWETHDALGWYLMARRDFVGADRAFQKMVQLAEAVGATPHPGYTQYLMQIGRHEERQALIQSIQHIDPLFPVANNLYFLGRREEAIAELERARGARTYIGGVKWWEGLERDIAIEHGDAKDLDERLFTGTELEGLWGTEAFLDVLRRELAEKTEPHRMEFAYYAIYAVKHGDIDLALQLLRREYLRDAYAGHYLIWHPGLAKMRASEGFNAFLRDLGLVEMFRNSGKWNDYCLPVGVDDFVCR